MVEQRQWATYAFRAIVKFLVLCVREDGGGGVVLAVFCHRARDRARLREGEGRGGDFEAADSDSA